MEGCSIPCILFLSKVSNGAGSMREQLSHIIPTSGGVSFLIFVIKSNKYLRNIIIDSLLVFEYFRRLIVTPSLQIAEMKFTEFLNFTFKMLHDFPLVSQEYYLVVSLLIVVSSMFIKCFTFDICFAIFMQYSVLSCSILFVSNSMALGFLFL